MAFQLPLGSARWAAIVALELNIGVHVALTPMHLEEKLYVGLLFIAGSAALFAAMLLLMSERLRIAGWVIGAVTSTGEFMGFVVSRTVGLPQGYTENWTASPEDYLGLLCLGAEALFVVLAVRAALVTRRFPTRRPACQEPLAHQGGSAARYRHTTW